MHRMVEESAAEVKAAPMARTLVSTNPATGEEIWSGAIGHWNSPFPTGAPTAAHLLEEAGVRLRFVPVDPAKV